MCDAQGGGRREAKAKGKGFDLTKVAYVGEGFREAGIGRRDLCRMGLILLAAGGRRDDGLDRAGGKEVGGRVDERARRRTSQLDRRFITLPFPFSMHLGRRSERAR